MDVLAFSDLTNMTYRTIPGCLGIVKTQPAFKNALEHSLHVQAGLLDHILFINRNNRIRRNNSRAVPGLHSNELALLTLVVARKATNDIAGDLVVAHPLTLLLLCHWDS